MVTTSAPAVLPSVSRDVHVLRWTFRRHDEMVVCELGLTSDAAAYELRIQPPWNPSGTTTETFDDAVSAFRRHGMIERILVNEGWSLESFQSEKTPRQP
jgi:hypothetical protein